MSERESTQTKLGVEKSVKMKLHLIYYKGEMALNTEQRQI